jgi:uncharacterized protein YjgD (DUF1641 family)
MAEAKKEVTEGVSPEVQAQALAELLDAVVNLKKSGILGMLSYLADKAEESFLAAATDPALMRLLALLSSVTYGITNVDTNDLSNAQNNLTDLTSCAMESLGKLDLSKPKSVGLLGLMRSLSDPDVSQGLGILLDIMKQLGACARSKGASKA